MEILLKILLSGLFALLFSAGYFILFWTLAGQTPGKILMGLRIMTASSQHISLVRAVRRMLGYILSIVAVWIGFL